MISCGRTFPRCKESLCRYPQSNTLSDMNQQHSTEYHYEVVRGAKKSFTSAHQDAETTCRISRYERLDVNSRDPKKLDVKTRNDIDAMDEIRR